MYSIIKAILFRLPAERAHYLSTALMNFGVRIPLMSNVLAAIWKFDSITLHREYWGLKFRNPVGLAAGFDKDGRYIRAMSLLGFGFIEVGTVTPLPQKGNPRPRLFRLPDDKAIINRMGFNNAGVDALVKNLSKLPAQRSYILGGNIGKNKITPNSEAYRDYLICFEKLYDYVDYFVVNLSSPNTPGLRELQDKDPLRHLLQTLIESRQQKSVKKPILLKIAPDLTEGQLSDVIDIVNELDIQGIIATNTTIDRSHLKTSATKIDKIGQGGLSGRPLQGRSTEVISFLRAHLHENIPIVGVGGIDSGAAANDKINAGASMIQVYSGLIYQGPGLIKRIKAALCR